MAIEPDQATASNLELALRQLSLKDGKFPEQALRVVQRQRETAIPRLIEAIEQATLVKSSGGEVEGNLHFFAIVLLTEFQAYEAWAAIRKAISLPGDAASDLFGGVITGVLPSIFALFCSDSIDTVDELVTDRSLYEYVRWSAVATYVFLVRDRRISREETVRRLRLALANVIRNEDSEGATPIILALYKFGPTDAMDEIREAYNDGLVDESILTLEDIEDESENGGAGFQKEIDRCDATGVPDTVELLRHWGWPGDEKPDERKSFPKSHSNSNSRTAAGSAHHSPNAFRENKPRVGRNDPCPCGSSKKFKKCCGNQ